MARLDLDSLLVLVDPKGDDADEVFRFSQNAKYRRFGRARDALTEDGDDLSWGNDLNAQMNDPKGTVNVHLAFSFDNRPKDISKGFVFGSDPETCDVLLARDKVGGISGNHFSISVDWGTGNPLITCLTPNEYTGIRIKSGSLTSLCFRHGWKVLNPGTKLTIEVSDDMQLVVHTPLREDREPAYSNHLRDYFKKYQDAVPEMSHLKLYDPEPTPLLVSRGRGLIGMEYFTISTVVRDKVVLCEAKSNQNQTRDSQTFIVKRFLNFNDKWPKHARYLLGKLRELRHPHIIQLEDIITETKEYMPVYLPEPLETLANRNLIDPLSEVDAGEVLAQVLEGLNFLHANDIVHGGLYPGSILIKHSHPWSIQLSDIGLNPYVDLEDPEERELYASLRAPFLKESVPLMDIWSAGVVGLDLLHPDGLPIWPRDSIFRRDRWTTMVIKRAVDFHASEKPGPEGMKEAALFLTRVLRRAIKERLTAEECLQDPWIQAIRLPPSEGPDVKSDEDTETEDPHTRIPKGKQPQKWRQADTATPSNTRQQRSATPQMGPFMGFAPKEPRHTSLKPSDSVSRQGSVAPPNCVRPGEYLVEPSLIPGSAAVSSTSSDSSVPSSVTPYTGLVPDIRGKKRGSGPGRWA